MRETHRKRGFESGLYVFVSALLSTIPRITILLFCPSTPQRVQQAYHDGIIIVSRYSQNIVSPWSQNQSHAIFIF